MSSDAIEPPPLDSRYDEAVGAEPPFNTRDLVVLERLLSRWPLLSGAYGPDVMEMLTKVRRALAALDEGRDEGMESSAT